MPAHVQTAGKTVSLPKGPLNGKQSTALIYQLRRSELSNARAVRDANKFYGEVRRKYKANK